MRTILTCFLLLPLFSFAQQKTKFWDDFYRQDIKQALGDKSGRQVVVNRVIPDKETAIAIAEPMLLKVYGQKHVQSEKPYVVYFVDGYWIVTGTLPKHTLGGTFSIILAAKDGRVIRLIHEK